MIRKISIQFGAILIICFVCVGQVRGQSGDFEKGILENRDQVNSISCQFVQELSLTALSEVQKSTGYFYYKNPGLLRWQQTDPVDYTLVINGDQSYIQENGNRKSLSAGSMQLAGFKRFILGTMDGSIFNSDHFKSEIEKNNNNWKVTMVPQKKTLSRRFEKIVLIFEMEKMLLLQLLFYESGGDTRTIIFTNHQLNQLADDTKFQ